MSADYPITKTAEVTKEEKYDKIGIKTRALYSSVLLEFDSIYQWPIRYKNNDICIRYEWSNSVFMSEAYPITKTALVTKVGEITTNIHEFTNISKKSLIFIEMFYIL